MKYLLFFISLCSFLTTNGQSIEKANLIGCWEFSDYADSLTMQDLNMADIFGHDIHFIDDNKYKMETRQGEWVLKEDTVFLYKSQFTEDEKEMAAYFKMTPREATKIIYPNIKLTGNFLYYMVYSEEEPFVMFAKLKKENCD